MAVAGWCYEPLSSGESRSEISRAGSSWVTPYRRLRRTTARRWPHQERWDTTLGWIANVARDVPRQPIPDGVGVCRQRAGVAGQPCAGGTFRASTRWTATEPDRGDTESAGSARGAYSASGGELPACRQCPAAAAGCRDRPALWQRKRPRHAIGGRMADPSSAGTYNTGLADRLLRPGGQPARRLRSRTSTFSRTLKRWISWSTRCSVSSSQWLVWILAKSLPDRRLLRWALLTLCRCQRRDKAPGEQLSRMCRTTRPTAEERALPNHRRQRGSDLLKVSHCCSVTITPRD